MTEKKVEATRENVTAAERTYGAAAHVAPLVWGNVLPVVGSFVVTLLASFAFFETVSIVRAARRAKAGEHYQYRMSLEFTKDGTER